MNQTIGLIAGHGQLPLLTARGIRASGARVACVGLRGQYNPALPAECDVFATAGVAQLGRWIRLLRRWGAGQAVMVGGVQKSKMYDPFLFFRYTPDWYGFKVWYLRSRRDRRTESLLYHVTQVLSEKGIQLLDTTRYIPEQLAGTGVMTRAQPTAAQRADIEFALPIARQTTALDIGQSLAVKDHEIIAVEAIEGTDAMIRRAGELCRSGQWTLMKLARPKQDMRFDVPTVGLKTIASLKAAHAGCLAIEAGRVIVLDKPEFLAAADQAGIAVVGVKVDG